MGSTTNALIQRFGFRKEFVRFSGSILPPKEARWCGPEFRNDAYYLRSAEWEAKRLLDRMGCNRETRILDMGCGQGRLPIGLIRVFGDMAYTGIDVHRNSIRWCKEHIERRRPAFQFRWLHLRNERYNPDGMLLVPGFQFDIPSRSMDVVYLHSVFSNMNQNDMLVYLTDFRRILVDRGKLFFTAYVEDNVPPVSINPEDYVFKSCSGPLHVVRYERTHLLSLIHQLGYAVEDFDFGTEVAGQSSLYLTRI
jgi:ubiquinone/menaquinone biosynthesis C-methylase UbiE